jgi:PAS domain S-box-containing protein
LILFFYQGEKLVHILEQDYFPEQFSTLKDWSSHANQPQNLKVQQGILNDLKEKTRAALPDYMIPANWYFIEEIPLTSHGKIDDKLLRNLRLGKNNYLFTPPTTDTERKLCSLWESCLNIDNLGINANFFENGGDSFRAVELINTITEITSLKRKISFLKKQKNKTQIYLENIISRMPGSVYWKDKEGVYLGCNDYVAEMAGVASTKEVIGKTDYEFSWKEEAPAILQTEREIMESEVPRELEISGKLSDGKKATFLVVKTPLYNDHKKVSGILATSLDITQRKKLEKTW